MMRFLKQVSIAITKLDSSIITKKGLFLTPIILAITTIVLLPIICAPTILFSFILIFYRTIRIRGNRFKTFGLSFVILIASLFIVKSYITEAKYIEGDAMMSAIPHHSRVIVDKTSYIALKPKRGDVVIFSKDIISPDGRRQPAEAEDYRSKISRVIGIPGDRVEIKEGIIWVNDQPLPGLVTNEQGEKITEQPFDLETCESVKKQYGASSNRKKPGSNLSFCFYLLRSDNTSNNDVYAVLEENIVGKVKAKFWPPDQIGYIADRQFQN
jgi:signal peptidase I